MMNRFFSFFNFLSLNFKFLINNKITLWAFFIFPVFAVSMVVVMFPAYNALGAIYLLGIIGPIGIVFSSTTFKFRNSTLYAQQELTRNSNTTFYLSSLFFMMILGYLIMIWISFLLIVLSKFDLLIIGYLGIAPSQDSDYYYDFIGIQWGGILLSVTEIILIMFSYSFVAKCFIKTEKTFFMIIIIFAVLSIIFGGIFNTYMSSISSAANGIDVGSVTYNNPDPAIDSTKGTSGNDLYFYTDTGVFPLFMFIPSLIFPFYGPGQLIGNVAWQTIWEVSPGEEAQLLWSHGEGNIWYVAKETDLWYPYWNETAATNWKGGEFSELYNSIPSWQYWVYPLILFAPVAHISFCAVVGITSSIFIKNI